ncbi:phage tail fiber protein [Paracraurococcus lichenis]|uniref:Phage tail protein n=1 Tax=Paracraurococcus lichenis TaxID=3064888 RepID=A0ABT9E8E6_9PROT|nr:hypothetical protein [Paracraurococcus sp. LOR1-02]MDO9712450.1 hypothetical protein [Paracraurococcus sp. LOR1-02]
MSKSDAFENAWLQLVFNNVNIANIGDATGLRGSTTAGNLYVSLHTADPGETGTEATSEISYTGYARQAVARSSAGWTVTGNSVSPTANIQFPTSTGGTGGTATHWSVGVASSGASTILYSGTITPNISVAAGVQPILLASGTTITED